MTLRLIREPSRQGVTLGVLFVEGVFFGFTCEDQIRERDGVPVELWKVPGETCIPHGRYRVIVTDSPKFGRPLPLLVNVPGFEGIRMHPGNSQADTDGCILPGFGRDAVARKVTDSRVACDALQRQIDAASGSGDPVWLSIENPL